MKAKIHIAIRQYEFIEFDIEAKNQAELDKKIKELSDHYHNYLDPVEAKRKANYKRFERTDEAELDLGLEDEDELIKLD